MYALTLWQPWASLIVSGLKRIENRDWPPWKRMIGQRIAIHASKRRVTQDDRSLAAAYGITTMPKGAVVGSAVIVDALTERAQLTPEHTDQGEWWGDSARWHWLLADVRALREPIPCKGAQGLWRLPDAIAAVTWAAATPPTAANRR